MDISERSTSLYQQLRASEFELPPIEDMPLSYPDATSNFSRFELLILNSCLDVNATSCLNESLLYWFCCRYRLDGWEQELPSIIEVLCKNGADVNFCSPSNGYNSAMVLIRRICHETHLKVGLQVTSVLIRYGLNVNHVDKEGGNVFTALLYQCVSFTSVVQAFDFLTLLVDNNFDVNQRKACKNFSLPCWRRSFNAFIELLDDYAPYGRFRGYDLAKSTSFLIEKANLDINATDVHGRNALMILSEEDPELDTIEISRKLLEHGLNVNQKNSLGENVLNTICFNTHYPARHLADLTELLLDKGVDADNVVFSKSNVVALLQREDRSSPDVWPVIVNLFDRSVFLEYYLEDILWLLVQDNDLDLAQINPVIRRLVEMDVRVNEPLSEGSSGNALLHFFSKRLPRRRKQKKMSKADEQCWYDFTKTLVDAGSDVTTPTETGCETALALFCSLYDGSNFVDILQVLLPNVSSKKDLEIAWDKFTENIFARHQAVEVCELFMQYGFNAESLPLKDTNYLSLCLINDIKIKLIGDCKKRKEMGY